MNLAVQQLLAYTPFLQPLPGAWNYWYLLLVPLCIGVAVVYKTIKCRTMDLVPREAAVIALWILIGMVSAALVLWGVVWALQI